MTLKAAKDVQLLVPFLLQTSSTAAHVLNLFRAGDGLSACESEFNFRGASFASQAKIRHTRVINLSLSDYLSEVAGP